jgi:thioesterase domain-containing protein
LLAVLDGYPIEDCGQLQRDESFDDGRFLADQLKALGYYSGDKPLEIVNALSILRQEKDLLSSLNEDQVAAIIEAFKHNGKLVGSFHPQRFDGDLLLFAAMQGQALRSADRWQPYVNGKIVVHEIDCQHLHMMRQTTLAKIGPVLASALQQQSPAAKPAIPRAKN